MHQQKFDIIPKISIHPDRITTYNEINPSPSSHRGNSAEYMRNLDNDQHGYLSKNAKAKMKRAITYLLFLSQSKSVPVNSAGKYFQFKVALVTLTLCSKQIHSDTEIKSLFINHFLVYAKQRWHMKRFVWRAEKQKNSNIHFHILTDCFIPWSELRDVWNNIQNKLGYVDRYREEMLKFHSGGFHIRSELLRSWSYKSQLKAYKAGKANDWNSPNSTDIHSLRFVNKTKDYITKYLAKETDLEKVNGRLWACSYELSNISGGQAVQDSYIKDELSYLVNKYKPFIINSDYYSIIFIDVDIIIHNKCPALIELFSQFLIEKFNFNLQTAF